MTTPTSNPVPSDNPNDLLFNAEQFDVALNSTAASYTDRLGMVRRTVKGQFDAVDAELAAKLGDAQSQINIKVNEASGYADDAADSALEALGYLQTYRATSYGALASDPATDPLGNPPTVGDEYFNTTSNLLKRFNGTTWQASDINTANLAASSGSSLVGYDGQTVQDVLDGVRPMQSYTALRAYTGRATGVRITAIGIAGDFYRNPLDTTVYTSSDDDGGVNIIDASGRKWTRKVSGNLRVSWFGSNALVSEDATVQIQKAFDYAGVLSNLKGIGSSISILISSFFPAVIVEFDPGVYKVTAPVYVNTRRIKIVGNNSLISTVGAGVLPLGFPIVFNEAYDTVIHGMSFGCTETGAVKIQAPNIGTAMVTFRDCRFIGADTVGGLAVYNDNQSCILNFEKCLFNNVKRVIEQVTGDWTVFDGCWFDNNFACAREDDSGYFNLVNGVVIVKNSLFAGGPATGNNRVAFFNVTGPVDLKIINNRIAFEGGSATIVNWKYPLVTSPGAAMRPGITMDNNTLSPRGEDVTYGQSTLATPVIRLYAMPNRIHYTNNNSRGTHLGLLVADSTTSNEALYNQVKPYIQLTTRQQNTGIVSYRFEGNNAVRQYAIPTTSSQENAKWCELFNSFNYAFEISNTNPDTSFSSLRVDTHFSGQLLDAGLFQVSAVVTHTVTGSRQTRQWLVRAVKEVSTATYKFFVQSEDDAAAVNGYTITLTPQFADFATNAAAATIPTSANLNDYYLTFLISPSSSSINISPMYVKPLRSENVVTGSSGGLSQYRFND